MAAGVPKEATAWGLNQLCGSGLRAVAHRHAADRDRRRRHHRRRRAGIDVDGAARRAISAQGVKMGDYAMVDTMLKDGLIDAFNGYHMGVTAENVAKQYQITRAQQDEFAVASQNKAEAAQKAGRFKDEIVPVTVKTRKGDVVVDQDEYIRRRRDARQRREAAPGLRQGGHGHRRQCVRHQRRRRGGRADDGGGGEEARHRAARAHRLLGDRRRRSGDHGDRARSRPRGGRWRRPAGRRTTSTSSRRTRRSRRRPARSTRTSAGTPTSSTSTAARSPSAIRSARRARAS